MTAVSPGELDDLLTVDELAAATGLTVRTTRYYSGLGLLPPPTRRGRVAYYTRAHRARLELIRALQDHGFTLSAIEKYLARVPADATVADLALQRVMLTSWTGAPHETLTRRQLERRVGRSLTEADLDRLERVTAISRAGDRFEVQPALEVAVQLIDLDLPVAALEAAAVAVERHMEALADELTGILHTQVLGPLREQERAGADGDRLEDTMARLRELTLEAVVAGFQRAANQVITRSLTQ